MTLGNIFFIFTSHTIKIFTYCRETLDESQVSWVKQMQEKAYGLIAETPPNGKQFVSAVKVYLKVRSGYLCIILWYIFFSVDLLSLGEWISDLGD